MGSVRRVCMWLLRFKGSTTHVQIQPSGHLDNIIIMTEYLIIIDSLLDGHK